MSHQSDRIYYKHGKKVVFKKCLCCYNKRKRDVSGKTPSSVDKNQTLKFKSKTVNIRACYGIDAPDKYCARTLSLF